MTVPGGAAAAAAVAAAAGWLWFVVVAMMMGMMPLGVVSMLKDDFGHNGVASSWPLFFSIIAVFIVKSEGDGADGSEHRW